MRILLLCFVMSVGLPVYGSQRCFDDRFCLTTKQGNNNTELLVENVSDLPVVLTVYAPQLIGKPHITVDLNATEQHSLGTLRSPRRFWQDMQVRWTPGVLNASHDDNVRYIPPLQPLSQYPVIQGFNGNYSHQGASRYAIDFDAPEGTPVLAARGGIVIDTKADGKRGGPSKSLAKYANYVAILHDDGTTGEYYHLRYAGVTVSRGDTIEAGQLIGYTGNTGFSSQPHLHFGVYIAKPHGRYDSVPVSFNPPVTMP
ncbi:M23 family metallopeptidase [Alteromonas sp. H39]|uniref:M23 family metallopeptidase n=1 Tax=Alteromonas sp. H39 TaxID=3389876 RepID=UPI0039DFAEE7